MFYSLTEVNDEKKCEDVREEEEKKEREREAEKRNQNNSAFPAAHCWNLMGLSPKGGVRREGESESER